MALDLVDRGTHWMAVMAVSTLVIGALMIVLIPGMIWRDKEVQKEQKTEKSSSKAGAPAREAPARKTYVDDSGTLEDEPWFPQLIIKQWNEAGELPDCPWSFHECESPADALHRIWGDPPNKGLHQAMSALLGRLKTVQVARVSFCSDSDVFFAVIYVLNSGAELFAGAPLQDVTECAGLDSLLPFYRIHDGFGVLLTHSHLPLVLTNPGDSIRGSCFYVFPFRGLELHKTHDHLLKFSRVDRQCVACVDLRERHPHVIFAEMNGEVTDDDEYPLDFVSDTIVNITGQRVVPDSAGHYGYSAH